MPGVNNQKLEEIFRDHQDALRGFISKRVADRDSVDDILQDSLCKAAHSMPSLKDDESLLPWLYAIIRNSIYNRYRQEKYDRQRIEHMAVELEEADEETQQEICTCYRALLPSLSSDYGQLISEIDLQPNDRAAVARRMNIPVASLNVKLHRARMQLRDKLIETCKHCAETGCTDCDCDH